MAFKLMVIDDETGICKVIGFIASQLGLEYRAVQNPLEAVERYIDYRPDIVILDMIMPERDGIDVLNEMLATGIRSRIVLMSGYGSAYLRIAEGVARFHAHENSVFLQKPFRRQTLTELLSGLLSEAACLAC